MGKFERVQSSHPARSVGAFGYRAGSSLQTHQSRVVVMNTEELISHSEIRVCS